MAYPGSPVNTYRGRDFKQVSDKLEDYFWRQNEL
jgi:hypothetical protein